MIQQELIDDTPRILVVENDLRWRRDHKKNLTRWGYRTFIAQGQGSSLLQDAIDKASIYRCHLALVDMRLLNHDSRADHSGLDLVPMLQPTQAIIVSGYADFNTARMALLEKGAKHFLGKEEGSRLLREVVEEILQSICAAKNEIEIEWPPGLSAETILSCLFPQATGPIPADQVADVLGRLFPNAKRLQLQTWHGSNDLPQSGTPLHSVLLKVYIDDLVGPEIVKIAPPEHIKKQSERYKTYVEGRLSGSYYTSLKNEACLWDIGAARYDFLGAPNQSMITWAQLYQSTESIDDLVEPLQFFFNKLWSDYYQRANSKYYYTLFDCYCGVWGECWVNRLHNSYHDKYFKIPTLNLKALHPVRWLLDKRASDGVPQTRLAVTHGDLHGGNLFVHDGHAWVIDFERTGPGPIYQDFAELEINILVQLTHFEDLYTFYQLAMTLLNADRADQIQLAFQRGHREAYKAFAVIKALRQLAEKKIAAFEIEGYLWCLLFDSVFLLSLPELASEQREKVLLLGGLICERLENGQLATFSPIEVSQGQTKNLAQTISDYWEQLNLYTPLIAPDECRRIAYKLGCLLYDQGNFKDARRAFEIAYQALDALRTETEKRSHEKEQLAEENADLYARLVHCCVVMGDEDAAFKYALAGKGRTFVDSLLDEGFDIFHAIDNNPTLANDPKWVKYRQLLQEINSIRAKLQTLIEEETTLWERLKSTYPTLAATQQAPSLTVDEARQLAEDLSW